MSYPFHGRICAANYAVWGPWSGMCMSMALRACVLAQALLISKSTERTLPQVVAHSRFLRGFGWQQETHMLSIERCVIDTFDERPVR